MSQQTDGNDSSGGTTLTLSSRRLLIALGMVAVVAGAFVVGTRSGAPANPATPAAVAFPSEAPAPIMSQAAASGYTVPQGNATAAAVAPYRGGARLVADYDRLDFGPKGYGEPVDAQFSVTNVGDAPLVIEDAVRVQTLAGC